jgi:nucleoid-associated protein EbfC
MEPQMDMQQILAAAQQMQEQLMNAQQQLADAEVTGTAGGGLVTATVNGQGELVDLTIDPAAVDTADAAETAQTIADLVLAAYRDACRAVDELQQQTMAPFAGLGGAGVGGLPGIPDIGEILGGAGAGGGAPGTGQPGGPAGVTAETEPADEGDEPPEPDVPPTIPGQPGPSEAPAETDPDAEN